MNSLKIFGIIALVMVAGTLVIPALAQQTQTQAQIMDCDKDCDGTPDCIKDQLRKKTMDCSCDGSKTQDRLQDGIMKQDRDRVSRVADTLKTQKMVQMRTRSC